MFKNLMIAFPAQVHILDGSHWVLETNFDEVLILINDFLKYPLDRFWWITYPDKLPKFLD
jgi:hypothetical protein